ncbi:MAG: FkbM family methyltransferase [Chloroflexi bacterium]|nr:FkbM family methyltransferase [Chloroflexota bacterium]
MNRIPYWMRALRWYSLHTPNPRGTYRLAAWLYTHRRIPKMEVGATLDRTLLLSLQLDRWIDYNMYVLGIYEAPLAAFFRGSLEADSVFLDIGAYIGQYTLLAAKHAPAGRVIAVEPHPESRQRLQANVARNSLSNVRILPWAAGQATSHLSFVLSEQAYNSGLAGQNEPAPARTIEVQVVPLDDIVQTAGLQRVDIIKIDVEGAEGPVLWGARHTLYHFRPLLILEIDRQREMAFGDYPEALMSNLREAQYDLYILQGWRLVALGKSAPEYGNLIGIPKQPR